MALKKSIKSTEINVDSAARSCDDVAADLASSDSATRRWAARDIVRCQEAASLLLQQLRKEADDSVRQVILTSLTQLGNTNAVEGLVDCLRSDDAGLRNDAIEAMKQLPEEVAPIMASLLKDADPDVRIFAVNILESLCHPDVEQWLIDVIESDAHVNVCATSVDLLGEVGSEKSTEALANLKHRFVDEPYIQFAAELAIKRIDGS